ncbi:MAG: ParB N-terminal domain-containing protein, partial [Selenomonadaceae bacterium]|nr:ParB N-terminal domain-containing protein [Selenomonadaceae bacterium]
MKQYAGNIMAYLNDSTKENIAENEHYTVELIDAYDIVPNDRNFYGIRDIESLAAKMALSGHVSPLEVIKREDGKYTLISGERRRAAVLLRYEAGEIKSSEVPCFVRKDFMENEKLTAKQVEMINIICSNSYRTKTPFEELDEILELEPIAKVYYEEERKNKNYGDGGEDFREFFAKKFLGIPTTTLQRTLALRHLVAEAREVYKQVPIPKTTLSELAYKKEEIQREILDQILKGELRGTKQEVKGYKAQDDNAVEENKTDNGEISNGENNEIPNNETEDSAPVKEEDKVEDDNADVADNTETNDSVSEVKEDASGSDNSESDQDDNKIADSDNNNGKVADESNEENSENSEDKENDQFDGEEEVPSDDTDEENQEEDISDESTEETEEPQ